MTIRILAFAVFGCCLALNPAWALVRMAVIAGNNEGLASDPLLRFAVSDAENVRNALEQLGGVDKQHSHLLLNADVARFIAKLEDTRRTIRTLKVGGEKVQLLLYFSGHGSQDALHMNGEKLPLDRIRNEFQDLGADLKLLIADACFSGSLLQGKGASLAPPVPVRYQDELHVNGSAILTSSSAGELAQESKEFRGSIFTHYFLSAIRGAGDADGDGMVTLWEAYHHTLGSMRRKLAAMSGVVQTPEFEVDLQGSESVILTRLSMGEASLVLKGLPPGRYQVFESVQARNVAEVQIQGTEGVVLSLPKGQYLVYRGRDGVGESAGQSGFSGTVDLRQRPSVTLVEADFHRVSPGSLFSKGLVENGEGASLSGSMSGISERRQSNHFGMGLSGLAYLDFPGWWELAKGAEVFAQAFHGNWMVSLGGAVLWDETYESLRKEALEIQIPSEQRTQYASTSFHQTGARGLSLEASYLWGFTPRMRLRPGFRFEWWRFDQEAQDLGDVVTGRTMGTLATLAWETFPVRHMGVTFSLRPGFFWFTDASGELATQFSASFALGTNVPW